MTGNEVAASLSGADLTRAVLYQTTLSGTVLAPDQLEGAFIERVRFSAEDDDENGDGSSGGPKGRA